MVLFFPVVVNVGHVASIHELNACDRRCRARTMQGIAHIKPAGFALLWSVVRWPVDACTCQLVRRKLTNDVY